MILLNRTDLVSSNKRTSDVNVLFGIGVSKTITSSKIASEISRVSGTCVGQRHRGIIFPRIFRHFRVIFSRCFAQTAVDVTQLLIKVIS